MQALLSASETDQGEVFSLSILIPQSLSTTRRQQAVAIHRASGAPGHQNQREHGWPILQEA
jgi:hypothetical protein